MKNRINRLLNFLVITTFLFTLCACSNKYKANDSLLTYTDQDTADLCLNMLLEYQERLEKYKENPDLDVDEVFTGTYIDKFNDITSDVWTGVDEAELETLTGDSFEEYKKSLAVWIDLGLPQYIVSDTWLNHSKTPAGLTDISDIHFVVDEDYRETFVKNMQKAIDTALSKYYM